MNEKNFFIKKSHVNTSAYIILGYITIIAVILFAGFKSNELTNEFIWASAIVLSLSTFITFLLVKYCNSIGMYINGANIYYKNMRRRSINVSDIKGIKVIQAYSAGGKASVVYDKDAVEYLKNLNPNIKMI